jgi:hypothetical protein
MDHPTVTLSGACSGADSSRKSSILEVRIVPDLGLTEVAVILSIFVLLTCIATYPVILSFDSMAMGDGDTVQNAWNLWWVREAVGRGQPFPYHTDMLYHPIGVSLAYHPLAPLNGWLGFFCQDWLGLSLPGSYNLIAIFSFVASGFTSYLLVRWQTGSRTAAFAASVIFTFAPIRMSRAHFGNLEMFSTQFIPLTVLALGQMCQSRRWIYAVWAALATAMTAWTSLYLALGTGILALLLLLSDLGQRGFQLSAHTGGFLFRWMLFGAGTALLMLPVVMPMITDYAAFRDQAMQRQAAIANSADLLGFIVPDRATDPLVVRFLPTAGAAVDRIYGDFAGNPAEKTVFIGYSVFALVLLALSRPTIGGTRKWLGIAGIFLVLCLGPVLHVAGNPLLPLPYALLDEIPLVGFGRAPSRMAVFLMLALAVVGGMVLAGWEARRPRAALASILVGLLIFLEFLIAPVRLDSRFQTVPTFYTEIARGQGVEPRPVLDVPIDLFGAQGPAGDYMLFQTVHGQPIVSGYISRTPGSAGRILERPFLHALRARLYQDTEPFHFSPEVMARAAADLRAAGVDFVVLHRDFLTASDFEIVRGVLTEVLREPVHEEERLVAWRVESGERAGEANPTQD